MNLTTKTKPTRSPEMAMTTQQTFVDRLNDAENALSELASFADHLTNRLVGYAPEAEAGYADLPPSNGILPDVGDTAGRIARKVRDISQNLSRIAESLPSETKPAILPTAQTGRSGY
jgi:hypothetical protein